MRTLITLFLVVVLGFAVDAVSLAERFGLLQRSLTVPVTCHSGTTALTRRASGTRC